MYPPVNHLDAILFGQPFFAIHYAFSTMFQSFDSTMLSMIFSKSSWSNITLFDFWNYLHAFFLGREQFIVKSD
jgi:hypothetical protein